MSKDLTETLFETWSLKGHFWLAQDGVCDEQALSNVVAGELSFDGLGDGVSLLLMGKGDLPDERSWEQDSDPWDLSSREAESSPEPPSRELWLHGRTICGRGVTLIGLTPRRGSRSAASILSQHSRWHVRCAIINAQLGRDEKLDSITVSFPGLLKFLGQKSGLFTLERESEVQRQVASVNLEPVSISVPATFEGAPVEFDLWYRAWLTHDFGWNLSLESDVGVTVASAESRDIYWWFKLVYSLQYFFSALYGSPVCPDRLYIKRPEYQTASIWYSMSRQSVKKQYQINDMMVNAIAFEQHVIVDALQKWFSMPKEFDAVIQQFFGNSFAPHSKARVDFVFHSQTLEIFHDFMNLGTPPLSETQRKMLQALKKHVDETIKAQDSDLWERIKQALNHAGKHTQKTRLTELFKILNAYTPGVFYDDPTAFVACIVDTRNFYIHGKPPEKDTLLDFEEQTAAVAGLTLALTLLLLRQLDIPEEEVRARLFTIKEYETWIGLQPVYLHADDLKLKATSKRNSATAP